MRNPNREDAEHRLANLIAQWVRAREDKAEAMAEHNQGIKALEESIEGLSAQIQGGQFQPSLPLGPAIQLADTDPDVQAAKAAESEISSDGGGATPGQPERKDAQSVGPRSDGTPSDDTGPLPTPMSGEGPDAAPVTTQPNDQTPAGEAVSPEAEPERQRKPRSDKGKARGPHKAGFVNTESGSVNGNQVPVEATPEPMAEEEAPDLPAEDDEPLICESCSHPERVHGDTGLRGCMVEGCECRKLRLPLADPDPLGLDGYPREEKGEVSDATA